jgi:elongation factor Ts
MSITAKQVNDLRQKTGVSMMACKKALLETNGDEEQAIEFLRKKGEAKAVEKSGRITKEGVVQIAKNNQKTAVVSVYCETDFVARNDELINLVKNIAEKALTEGSTVARGFAETELKELFNKLGENLILGDIQIFEGKNIGTYVHSNNKIATVVVLSGGAEEMGKDIAMHITAMNPKVISPAEIADDLIHKEKEIWIEQLKNEGKPDHIIENILKGKEKKFREEAALLKQAFVKNPEVTIEKLIGEFKIEKFVRVEI